ncbi:hypothetical protein [Saccharopolyspora elongata]|uniref:hypothetical protein n=1 Tax=Saccharopolyspora elongata TaxID=2530387 RepID=UPI001A9DCE89|nr:hypothetical protein [Saccharopolyspora elongata]
MAAPSILDEYVTSAPSPQNAVDVFAGEWSSQLPAPLQHVQAGPLPLFDDARVSWAIECFGGVAGSRVLEIGPLEGGHTYHSTPPVPTSSLSRRRAAPT